MKSYHIIPSLMAGLLAVALTGCSSTSTSFTPEKAQKTDQTQSEKEKLAKEQAEKDRLAKEQAEKDRLAKEQAEKDRLAKEQAEKRNWREFVVVGSNDGGYTFEPVKNKNGDVFYSSGPIVLSKDGKAVKIDDKSLNYDRDLFKNGKLAANEIQELVIKDANGKALGTFKFVNQNYSTYATFMSAKPANEYDPEYDVSEPLAFYTAKASTGEQLAAQKGQFTYKGTAIGYLNGVKGDTPTKPASTDVVFNVDFDRKVISGEIKKRFDQLGEFKFIKTWMDDPNDPDNELPVYHEGYETLAARQAVPLILGETAIKVNKDGIASFGGDNQTAESNVFVEINGERKDISSYGGVFAGPELNEVVGQIGGGEERISFGATKEKK